MNKVKPSDYKLTRKFLYHVKELDIIDHEMVTSMLPKRPFDLSSFEIHEGENEVEVDITSPLTERKILPDEGLTKVSRHKIFAPVADKLGNFARDVKNASLFHSNIIIHSDNEYLEIREWDGKEHMFLYMIINLEGFVIFERKVGIKNTEGHNVLYDDKKMKIRIKQKPNLQIVK